MKDIDSRQSLELVNNHIISASTSLERYQETYIHTSEFGMHYLYYLESINEVDAVFPFYFELSPLNSTFLLYTMKGQGKLTYNDNDYILKPETIIFIDCNKSFRVDLQEKTHWQFQSIFINGNSTFAYYQLYAEQDYVLCPLSPISKIPSILEKLLNCRKDNEKWTELICSKLITDLLTELIFTRQLHLDSLNTIPKYISDIKKKFDTEFAKQYNLDTLAAIHHVSKYKLIRDFTNYLSQPPISYLISRRMDEAKKLLWHTEDSVYEIASLVGIENINHFTNLFKKCTGMTPINYRKIRPTDSSHYLDD